MRKKERGSGYCQQQQQQLVSQSAIDESDSTAQKPTERSFCLLPTRDDDELERVKTCQAPFFFSIFFLRFSFSPSTVKYTLLVVVLLLVSLRFLLVYKHACRHDTLLSLQRRRQLRKRDETREKTQWRLVEWVRRWKPSRLTSTRPNGALHRYPHRYNDDSRSKEESVYTHVDNLK